MSSLNQTQRKQAAALLPQELAEQGVTLNRRMRRNLKKVGRHNPRLAVKQATGLVLLQRCERAGKAVSEEMQKLQMTNYYAAIDAVIGGRAEGHHINVITDAINVAYILTELDPELGIEHRTTLIFPAMKGAGDMLRRRAQHGTYGLDAAGLKALRDFAALHEIQLAWATQGEFDASFQKMLKDIAARRVFTFENVPE